ncbi:MAG: glycosyltransferase family 2 protein [Methyloprofundus sp.]|nr:glycosyltransferase family 2 protein [Methyloprofundus sp.]
MDITIIICSYNRSSNLPDCFSCLEKQLITVPIQWEILLIDNNSSDDTKMVTTNFNQNSALDIRYIFEPKQGLSNARNRGIAEAIGTYLIFIDDDIRVTENWLQSIFSTFKQFDCDAVGGRIHIESPAKLPKWITTDMYGFLGHQDFGKHLHKMDGIEESPFGGNMAIHQRVIDLIGNFDVEMGRKGTGLKKEELFKGEETDFFMRLAAAGGNFYYHPDALVFHKILPHQLKKVFFLTLHNNSGILTAKADTKTYKKQFMGIPLFIFPQLMRAILSYLKIVMTKGPNHSIRQLMNVYYFCGMIYAYQIKDKM